MKLKQKFFLFLPILLLLSFFGGKELRAEVFPGYGSSKIYNDDLRAAYNSALGSALLNSVNKYFDNRNTPRNINQDYIRFIKSYHIISKTISDDNRVIVQISADLDSIALNDANLYLQEKIGDSVVYLYYGIADDLIPRKEIEAQTNATLQKAQFSTSGQVDFRRSLQLLATEDRTQIINTFRNSGNKYLFIINFNPVFSSQFFENSVNACEIVTNISINNTSGAMKEIKLQTGSTNQNSTLCYNEAISTGIKELVAYIRENIIPLPKEAIKLQSYNLVLVNFQNMVQTKTLLETLKQRGLIRSSKSTAFSQSKIEFEIETFLSPTELSHRIEQLNLDYKLNMEATSSLLMVDFKIEQ